MTSTLPESTYADAEYENAHRQTFSLPAATPIKSVLPPGLSQAQFDAALEDLIAVVGKAAVFVNEALAHYVDPYEVYVQDEAKRKLPSAAVWYECNPEHCNVFRLVSCQSPAFSNQNSACSANTT